MKHGVRFAFARAALALAVAAPAGACVAEGAARPPIGETPFEVIARWRPKTDTPDMPDFVKRTRPPEQSLDYAPLTGPEAKGPRRKSPEELARLKHNLDAAVAKNRSRAARDFAIASPKRGRAAR